MASYRDLGSGKYKLFVELGYDAKGKRIRRTKTVEASGPRAAAKLLAAYETEVYNSQHIEIEKSGFTEFSERWFKSYVLTELEASTAEIYEILLKNIVAHFERMKLKDIKTFHIIEYFNSEKLAGRGSLEKKYNILQSIFKHAILWKVLTHNPMDGVKKNKPTKKETEFYDKEEIALLMQLKNSLLERQQLIIEATLIGGLRRGETLGISEDAINWPKNQIKIFRSLQHTKNSGLRLKGTKTENTRIVTYPESFMKRLRAHYISILNLKMSMGDAWKGFKDVEGKEVLLLFADEYGVPYLPTSATRFWGRFMQRNEGVIKRIRFQDLRHSSASLILSEGVNMKVLQKRLGHKNIKTTLNIYSHITEKDDQKASDVFKNLF